jgi:TatD DNase family protein
MSKNKSLQLDLPYPGPTPSSSYHPLDILRNKYPNAFGDKFKGCITNCCDPENWHRKKWFEGLAEDPNVFLAFGCHPSKAHMYDSEKEELLENYLQWDKVVALGEIGLDSTYYGKQATKDMQIKAFKRQLQLAVRVKLPVVIHLRGNVVKDAHEIMRNILNQSPKNSMDIGIHMHCFTYSLLVAQKFIDDFPGMKFGIVPDNFQKEVGKRLPLNKILIETDAPYFIPQQLKSKRNKKGNKKFPMGVPGFAYHSAAQIAAAKKISPALVLEANQNNVLELYDINFGGSSCSSNYSRQVHKVVHPNKNVCGDVILIKKSMGMVMGSVEINL